MQVPLGTFRTTNAILDYFSLGKWDKAREQIFSQRRVSRAQQAPAFLLTKNFRVHKMNRLES